MADSAVVKLQKDRAEKEKSYKCTHDIERVHHLILSAFYMRDFPATSALAASMVRELSGMNLKQIELDAKEKEDLEKAYAEALASDSKAQEAANTSPLSAPSAPRR